MTVMGFPGGSEVKESACNVGDLGSIPGSGRSPGERNGNLLQLPCSSILAWRVPWTEEHGGLQSTGSQRVRHDFTFTFTLVPIIPSVFSVLEITFIWELSV